MKNKYLTWVEISKTALRKNLASFKKLVGKRVILMPVLKSNAYGHGLVEVARSISSSVSMIGVVSLSEAITLRRNKIKKPIMVLSYFQPDEIAQAIDKKIILPVCSFTMARQISDIASKKRKKAKVHLKIDVGTSRLGVLAESSLKLVKTISKLPGLKIEGVYSHLADSENFDQRFTKLQIEIFNKTVELLRQAGLKIKYCHLACSAAVLINPKTHLDIVRVGIGFYGLWPSSETKKLYKKKNHNFKIDPVLSWHTRLIQKKIVGKNVPVGYGCAYRTKRKTIVGVIPVGYWDGYDRKLSNIGEVLFHNKKKKVIGRVCMNMTMIDITNVPQAKIGEIVTLIGRQGGTSVSADDIALKTNTINYEVVTRINPQIPRLIK
ncbi:alanine racemase [Patescibacteria group bacterium]|nr:alanine racemase [Patescibacteria group bacterium]